jgi:spore germination cell wall hydrolase CwlJ-like protein
MDQPLTPSRLWKKMTPEQRLQAAQAFWQDEEAANDQVQAVLLISQQKKFRPKTVIGLDDTRKARHLATLGSLPDAIAARALIVYHLSHQREMMATFLDALGIAHEDGLIKEDEAKPDPEKLGPAVAAITAKYPAEDVSLYLSTLLSQDPETWEGLKKVEVGS